MIEKHPIELSLLANTYEIERTSSCEHLNEWLSATYELTAFEQMLFDNTFSKNRRDINYYNEEELKMHLISPLFIIADIDIQDKVKIFFERPLKAIIKNHSLSVICDCMIAKPLPFNRPKQPYFFLQEFKKGKGDDKDPEAQMLAAMLIAQNKNADNMPIFGGYIMGSHWYFTTLVGNQYCSSLDFDADRKEDLLKIVFALRKIKELIINRL